MRLTEHFKLSEFTNSSTATARGIDNTPNEQQIANLKRICEEILEPLRAFAGQPIIIGSGYRSPALNKAVGGVKNSQHMTGEAADIRLPEPLMSIGATTSRIPTCPLPTAGLISWSTIPTSTSSSSSIPMANTGSTSPAEPTSARTAIRSSTSFRKNSLLITIKPSHHSMGRLFCDLQYANLDPSSQAPLPAPSLYQEEVPIFHLPPIILLSIIERTMLVRAMMMLVNVCFQRLVFLEPTIIVCHALFSFIPNNNSMECLASQLSNLPELLSAAMK